MYIDGFLIPVPKDKREDFVAHARSIDDFFIANGATRVVETMSEDVPKGEHTDFYRAVSAEDGEAVAFSWIEWPDKATRDAAMAKMREEMADNPIFDPAKNPMPFDGKRMIFGGFEPVYTLRGNP